MMQFIKANKVLSIAGLATILIALVYYMFFANPSSSPAVVAENQTNNVSRELVITLSNLNTIRLNDAIFTDPVFLSLSDFGVQIPLQPIGRRNPFAPF